MTTLSYIELFGTVGIVFLVGVVVKRLSKKISTDRPVRNYSTTSDNKLSGRLPEFLVNNTASEIIIEMPDVEYRYRTMTDTLRVTKIMQERPARFLDCEITGVIGYCESPTDGIVVQCKVASAAVPDLVLGTATVRFSRMVLETDSIMYLLSTLATKLAETEGLCFALGAMLQLCAITDAGVVKRRYNIEPGPLEDCVVAANTPIVDDNESDLTC